MALGVNVCSSVYAVFEYGWVVPPMCRIYRACGSGLRRIYVYRCVPIWVWKVKISPLFTSYRSLYIMYLYFYPRGSLSIAFTSNDFGCQNSEL